MGRQARIADEAETERRPLIELGKPFDYFAYPNWTHAISEGAGTTLHPFNHLIRSLRNDLPAGAQ